MKFVIKMITILVLLSGFVTTVYSAPTVYVPLGDKNEIAVIDAQTSAMIGLIQEVTNPHGLAITPDEKFLIAGAYTELKPDEKGVPPKPSSVSEDEHKRHHQITTEDTDKIVGVSYVSLVNAATRKVVHQIEVKGAVHHTNVTPDGRFAIATHPSTGGISVIDLQLRKVSKIIATGSLPNYAVVTDDGDYVYVSNAGNNTVSEIDTKTWTVTRNFSTGTAPEHIILSQDGTELYVNNIGDGTASVIVKQDGSTRKTYSVGTTPHGIDVSSEGDTLFVASKDDNRLVAINIDSDEVRTLTLEPAPYHVTSVKGTNKLYVSSRSEEKIWVIDQQSLSIIDEIALDGIGHQMVVSTQ